MRRGFLFWESGEGFLTTEVSPAGGSGFSGAGDLSSYPKRLAARPPNSVARRGIFVPGVHSKYVPSVELLNLGIGRRQLSNRSLRINHRRMV